MKPADSMIDINAVPLLRRSSWAAGSDSIVPNL
jgi:hypothetical protein